MTFTTETKAKNEDTWLSPEIQGYCKEIGMEQGVCPELLEAIIERESSGQSNVSNGNCKGLMQVNEPYHKERMQKYGVTSLYDAYGNIEVGADYLLELFETYEDEGTVLMVYSGVSNAVSRGESGNYTSYAKSVMKRAETLERIHGK